MERVPTVVIYDVPSTRIRTKLAEACLDAGLERIQFSAFRGFLTSTGRKELACRLRTLLEDAVSGRLFVLPLCVEDWNRAIAIEQGDAGCRAPHKSTGETILRF